MPCTVNILPPPSGGPTSTHVFCGIGGDTEGFKEAGFDPRLALNHSPVAVASHMLNFPDCDHDTADINNYDMRALPKTDVLVGSPICKEGSPAGGNPTPKTQPKLGEQEKYTPAATWERTRATAYDLLRHRGAPLRRRGLGERRGLRDPLAAVRLVAQGLG